MMFLIIGKFILFHLVVAAVVLIIIKVKKHVCLQHDHAINLLKTRFAKGDIDAAEFKEKLEILKGE